jgi:cell division protein FtsN
MKWLFSILLIANLGMFIWLFPQQVGVGSYGHRPEDIGQLRLVGERLEPTPEVGSEDASEIQPPSVEVEAELQVSPPETEPVAAQELPPESVAAQELPPESVAAPELPPPESAAAPELSPAVVVEEETVAEEVEPPVAPTPSEVPDVPICGTVGKFDKRSQAELLSVRLLAQGIKTEIASESSNEQAGFWVLIPPQPNRGAAVKIAKRLEAAGVADLWRFTSGKLAHAVSLGLFRNRERAKARRDKIADLGFEPEVRPRYRERTRYWVNYRYTEETPLSEIRWQELREQYPELEWEEEPCS